MIAHPAFGIEVSDGALKAVKLERSGARLVVTRAFYRPYARAEEGAVRPVAGLLPPVAAALRSFVDDARPGPLDRIYVGFPSISCFNRLVRVPDVGDERAADMARFEIVRSLRGPVEDYTIRTALIRSARTQGEIPALLFAAPRRILDAFVSDLAATGLEYDNLLPSPAALALFARYDHPATGDRIVVSIGLRATEVAYLRDRGHASRTLPLGIVGLQAFRADDPRREAAARRLARRVAAEIGKGATFFFGREGAFAPAALLLFGEGAALPPVVDELQRLYPTRVEVPDQLRRIGVHPGVPEELRARLPQMASALGLALAAARLATPELELLERNPARAAARRFPGLVVSSLLLAGAGLWLAHRGIREAETVAAAEVRPTAAELTRRAGEAAELVARAQRLAAVEAAVAERIRGRAARAPLLSAVLACFGPEIVEFGAVDLRLVDLDVARSDGGATIAGTASAPADSSIASTVLRQRLQAVPGLEDVRIHEDGEDAGERRTLRFEARGVPPAGGRP